MKIGIVFSAVVVLTLSLPSARAGDVDMTTRAQELKDLKFGMFVCWSFSTFSDKEWTRGVEDVSFFNPSGADTDRWASVAKDAGMGYILFLTKHHDGFCLWDTKTTDWKVTNSSLGIDVLAAVKKSCDKFGLKLAFYFSEGDWTWPDMKDPEKKKAQLKELCTEYGPIEFFWMDHAQTDGGLSHKETAEFVKQFQPGCFVGFNHGEVAGDIRLGEMAQPGPLDSQEAGGPYNKVVSDQFLLGEFTFPIIGLDPPRWFYTSPANDQTCMPAEKIYKTYLDAVKYGNIFSLDVAPDRTGCLRDIDVRTLREVGRLIREGENPQK
jgi:alpha-L-fucosidase